MSVMEVSFAKTEEEIKFCFPVMKQLRPHLDEGGFVSQVKRQMQNHGYRLVFVGKNGCVKAVAGYRIAEYLAWGKSLYVDDLITNEADRKSGFGGALLDWLLDVSKKLGCSEFHLDSGVHRFDAHRLYLIKKMNISSHHFSKRVE